MARFFTWLTGWWRLCFAKTSSDGPQQNLTGTDPELDFSVVIPTERWRGGRRAAGVSRDRHSTHSAASWSRTTARPRDDRIGDVVHQLRVLRRSCGAVGRPACRQVHPCPARDGFGSNGSRRDTSEGLDEDVLRSTRSHDPRSEERRVGKECRL